MFDLLLSILLGHPFWGLKYIEGVVMLICKTTWDLLACFDGNNREQKYLEFGFYLAQNAWLGCVHSLAHPQLIIYGIFLAVIK